MMDLREPKKKKRVRFQPQSPLPISTNENGEWKVYTAHLSASGTCIVDPAEMEAVYSMGFFGKGSLSRSFPSYGRRRFGAPPIIRNRQWPRRQKWLEELQTLNKDSSGEDLETVLRNRANDDLSEGSVEDKGSEEKLGEATSEILSELDKSTENKIDNAGLAESNEITICDKKASDDDSKDHREFEETRNMSVSNESLTEIPLDEKNTKFDFTREKSSKKEIQKRTDDFCGKLAASEKSRESTSNATCEFKKKDANSSIEFIEDETRVKKAKISNNEEIKNDDKKDSVSCVEPMNVDEVFLDSPKDEEICEIVEKDQREEGSPSINDTSVLDDDVLAEKSQDRFMHVESEDSIAEEEKNSYELLVLPDTDSDTDNYLKNVQPKIEKDGFPVNETLHLTFEETFFLMYGLGCLQLLHYDGFIFSVNNTWNYFQQQDKYFIQKYVVYHYFRSKGWIVKPGMKFGGDFLLYKQGPPFYHASYIVIIEVMDADTLIRDDGKSLRKITWKNLIGLERLSETIAKEILFAQILWPSSIMRNNGTVLVEALQEFTVRELLWRRWDPKRKNDIALVEEEDSDST